MKKVTGITIMAFLFIICLSLLFFGNTLSITNKVFAADENPNTSDETDTVRERIGFVKEVNFTLKDGTLVYGRLITRDRSKIILEQVSGSKILASEYSLQQVDPRTIRTSSMPESKYYTGLAELFTARTGDFADDPDDFIQAIRWHEKAKRILSNEKEPDTAKIMEIDGKIKELEADRSVWTKQAESRAKLKNLEFEATSETRVRALEAAAKDNKKIIESMQNIDEKLTAFENTNKNTLQYIEKNFLDLNTKYALIEGRVTTTERMLDRFSGYNDRNNYNSQRYYRVTPQQQGQ